MEQCKIHAKYESIIFELPFKNDIPENIILELKSCPDCSKLIKLSNDFSQHIKNDHDLNESELESMNIIRSSVVKQIQIKNNLKKMQYNWALKIAAMFLIINVVGVSFYIFTNDKSKADLKIVNIDPKIIEDTKFVLTSFKDFNQTTPDLLIQINIEESKDLLNKLNELKLKSKNTQNMQFLKDLERILIAISSLTEDDALMQIKLIQRGMNEKKIINQINLL